MTVTATDGTVEKDDTGFLGRLRNRWPWFDHIWRAQLRYSDSKGDFYAAGITYFTIFALFPILMVAFAAGGFLLVNHPELLTRIEDQVRATISGDLGNQLIALMDAAIDSRTSVGVIGLATAGWAGLGWMNNFREALSQMWGRYRSAQPNFLLTKLSDLRALLLTFAATVVTVALTAVSTTSLFGRMLRWLHVPDSPLTAILLRTASVAVAVFVSWLLFTVMIARLPRDHASVRSCMRAGLIAAVGFEVFKQVASIYLKSVMTGPAGATFGPVLGVMVFAYVTARLLLFATAWAATARENIPEETPVPGPVVIRSRPIDRGVPAPGYLLAAAAASLLAGLGWSRWRRPR